MKSFCIYYHKLRHAWQVTYRTRVTKTDVFPRGIALLHLGFAPTIGDAAIVRDEFFYRAFGPGGLVIAWNQKARKQHRTTKSEAFIALLKEESSNVAQELTESENTQVENVLRALEKDTKGDQS